MPLVFVHGVNVREGHRYDTQVEARNALFRRFALRALSSASHPLILNPYWGNSGVTFRWNNASLPAANREVFGGSTDIESLLLANFLDEGMGERDQLLLTVARRSLLGAVDLAVAGAAALVNGKEKGADDDLAAWAAAAVDIAEEDRGTQWVAGLQNDAQLLSQLDDRVRERLQASTPTGQEVFGTVGVRERVREAVMRLAGSPTRVGSAALLAAKRAAVHAHATRFLGDVFVYLLQRERGSLAQPGAILETVLSALQQAWGARTLEDPHLIVVAHSMGGSIMYELVSHYLPQLNSPIQVDVLVTVGSQVGMFEEMKLFSASDPTIPQDAANDRVPKPAVVNRWINVFDRNDVFSFAGEGVFSGVEDFAYSTGMGLLGAHGAYCTLPSFHSRLEARVRVAS